LAWTRRNASIEPSRVELIANLLLDLSVFAVLLDVGDSVPRFLGFSSGFIAFFDLLLVQLDVVMLKIPLTEWICIDGDNAVLHDGLSSDELIVGGVVDNIQNSSLSSDGLRSPGEITLVVSQSTIFEVASSAAHWSNSFGSNLGVGWLTAHFELSLLLMDGHSASSGPSLMS